METKDPSPSTQTLYGAFSTKVFLLNTTSLTGAFSVTPFALDVQNP
jgi:hypothetical protein